MEKNHFREQLFELSSKEFCRRWVFGPEAWLFENAGTTGVTGSYIEFQNAIAGIIDTSPNNISLVGSAKLGFSMKPVPQGRLKNFGRKSDVDIVIISDDRFEVAWSACRSAHYSGHTNLISDHAKEIFKKFIILRNDRKYPSKYLREIVIMIDEIKKVFSTKFRIRQPINYRLYASWDDAEKYHVAGIEQLKAEMKKNVK